jgi:hypothetical protein
MVLFHQLEPIIFSWKRFDGQDFRVSEEKPQARCSASCEDFDEAGAEKTSKPGEMVCSSNNHPL